MPRRVLITGLCPVTGLGIGLDANWRAMLAGQSAVAPLTAFDPGGFDCRIASQIPELKANQYVPKSYRKAVKVMARDIEIAVAAADLAARDARLITKGTAEGDTPVSYASGRIGANIGAGLIAAELNELTAALAEARREDGTFDMHKWGREGIGHLTPLWLLKYLPNMLACHVTIIHDAQGPSNTITCAEASAGLSVGEALRVLQRGAADVAFAGGAESKVNPMAYLRQAMTQRLCASGNDNPTGALRPFSRSADGSVVGEGGGLVILEDAATFEKRAAAGSEARAYAFVAGFGASQSVHREARNLKPDPQGKGLSLAIRAALRDGGIKPEQIDLVIPFGIGVPEWDQAEAAGLWEVFGDRLAELPLVSLKPMVGNCGAGVGAIDIAIAAQALATQKIPAIINCDDPLPGLCCATSPSRDADLKYVLTYAMGLGGQNAALVLGRA